MHSFTLLEIIGNTPLVEISHFDISNEVRIYAKLEGANPGGSIKDRAALYMFRKAQSEGLLKKNRIIIEPTSGNTRIALAMIGAVMGERVRLLMPECYL